MLYVGVGCCVRVIELLVAEVELLNPTLTPFADTVGGVLIRYVIIGEPIQLIAEGQAIVVEAEHEAHLTTSGVAVYIGILIGRVAALAALAGEHGIVHLVRSFSDALELQSYATAIGCSHSYGGNFYYLDYITTGAFAE